MLPQHRDRWRPDRPSWAEDRWLTREAMWDALPDDGSWLTGAEWRRRLGLVDVYRGQFGLAVSWADVSVQRVFRGKMVYRRREGDERFYNGKAAISGMRVDVQQAASMADAKRAPCPDDRAYTIRCGTWDAMTASLLAAAVSDAGSIREASKVLGVPRSTLSAWVRRFKAEGLWRVKPTSHSGAELRPDGSIAFSSREELDAWMVEWSRARAEPGGHSAATPEVKPARPANHYKTWTREEIAAVSTMSASGKSPHEIAAAIGRTVSAVRQALWTADKSDAPAPTPAEALAADEPIKVSQHMLL